MRHRPSSGSRELELGLELVPQSGSHTFSDLETSGSTSGDLWPAGPITRCSSHSCEELKED